MTTLWEAMKIPLQEIRKLFSWKYVLWVKKIVVAVILAVWVVLPFIIIFSSPAKYSNAPYGGAVWELFGTLFVTFGWCIYWATVFICWRFD